MSERPYDDIGLGETVEEAEHQFWASLTMEQLMDGLKVVLTEGSGRSTDAKLAISGVLQLAVAGQLAEFDLSQYKFRAEPMPAFSLPPTSLPPAPSPEPVVNRTPQFKIVTGPPTAVLEQSQPSVYRGTLVLLSHQDYGNRALRYAAATLEGMAAFEASVRQFWEEGEIHWSVADDGREGNTLRIQVDGYYIGYAIERDPLPETVGEAAP
ncbi:MAG: hypothetical protein NTZ05_01885 [Chloroflexi bacterium]|nr:hypothetical protein [Chloroflexota bacterium]